jgi:hypothetical protein
LSTTDVLTENDSLTIAEFSSLLGLPASAIIEAIRRNRTAIKKAYYTISDLALRWSCSRALVYTVIAESEFKILDLTREGRTRGRKLVPAATVEELERGRAARLVRFEK